MRTKKYEPNSDSQVYIPKHSTLRTSIEWIIWNSAIEAYWNGSGERPLFLRYEDFVSHPRTAINQILQLVGENGRTLPLVNEHTVELSENHTVAGNPVRFSRGRIELQLDSEWEVQMRWAHKALVLALTWPFMYRYGYLDKSRRVF